MTDWANAMNKTMQSMKRGAHSFVDMTNAFSMTRDEFMKTYQGLLLEADQPVQPTPRKVPAAANVKTFYVCQNLGCRVDEFWSWPGTVVANCPACALVSTTVSSTTKP